VGALPPRFPPYIPPMGVSLSSRGLSLFMMKAIAFPMLRDRSRERSSRVALMPNGDEGTYTVVADAP